MLGLKRVCMMESDDRCCQRSERTIVLDEVDGSGLSIPQDIFTSLSDVAEESQIQDTRVRSTQVGNMDLRNLHKSRRT